MVRLRLQAAAQRAAPVGLTSVFLLLGVIPLHLPVLHPVMPSLPLVAVFYWTLYRPDLMPTIAVFALGLMEDVLSGAPLGLNALMFMLIKLIVGTQRRYFAAKPFEVIWLGFTVVVIAVSGLSWLLASAYYLTLVDGTGVVMQAIVTMGIMPVIWRVLIDCHIGMLKQV